MGKVIGGERYGAGATAGGAVVKRFVAASAVVVLLASCTITSEAQLATAPEPRPTTARVPVERPALTNPVLICSRLDKDPPNHYEWKGDDILLGGDRVTNDDVRAAVAEQCPTKQTLITLLDRQVVAHEVWLDGWGG